MARALHLAAEAGAAGEVPVGAVVYELSSGAVLSEASNTREHARDPAGHAEFLAVVEACRTLGDWRLNACGVAVTLEPCPMCAGLMVNARVGRVVYGAADPKGGACRSLYTITTDPRLNHRVALVPGVMALESAALLRSFFRARRGRGRGPGGDAGA
ncbi:MAG: nucleoside deaminase [Phycisphaerales bacterium]|nr:MAG: nucleoside deaminase [Phycisphaerales bacterium]